MVIRVAGNIRVATIRLKMAFLKGSSSFTRLYAAIEDIIIVASTVATDTKMLFTT